MDAGVDEREHLPERIERLGLTRSISRGRGDCMALAHVARGTDELLRAIAQAQFASCYPEGIVIPYHGRADRHAYYWCELLREDGHAGAIAKQVDDGYLATEPGQWAVIGFDLVEPAPMRVWTVARYRVADLVLWISEQTTEKRNREHR